MTNKFSFFMIAVIFVGALVVVFRDKLRLDLMLALLVGLVLAFLVRLGSGKARDFKDRYGL
jgi:membrane protein implicated in regulation of membrane protease activity